MKTHFVNRLFSSQIIFFALKREVPGYSKAPDKKENWLSKGKTVDRTRYYNELYTDKVKREATEQLKTLKEEMINAAPYKIKEGDTLSKYLLRTVCKNDKNLMKQALSNLQSQGYQVDSFPAGYTVEIVENKLAIYTKKAKGEKIYYLSPDTNLKVMDLTTFTFQGLSESQSQEILIAPEKFADRFLKTQDVAPKQFEKILEFASFKQTRFPDRLTQDLQSTFEEKAKIFLQKEVDKGLEIDLDSLELEWLQLPNERAGTVGPVLHWKSKKPGEFPFENHKKWLGHVRTEDVSRVYESEKPSVLPVGPAGFGDRSKSQRVAPPEVLPPIVESSLDGAVFEHVDFPKELTPALRTSVEQDALSYLKSKEIKNGVTIAPYLTIEWIVSPDGKARYSLKWNEKQPGEKKFFPKQELRDEIWWMPDQNETP